MAWPDLKLRLACTGWSRLRGLLFQPRLAINEGLCLIPCTAVHTFGMAYPIDVVFLDAHGRVLRCVSALAPRRIALCSGAACAVELVAGYCARHPDYANRVRLALQVALARPHHRDSSHRIL